MRTCIRWLPGCGFAEPGKWNPGTQPEGGNCLFTDGHARWSNLFGRRTNTGKVGIPWWHMVETVADAPDSCHYTWQDVKR